MRDCRAAPMVERRAPIRIIHIVGKASKATVRPPEAVPNLRGVGGGGEEETMQR